jgi:hypothetical protein
MDQLTNPHLSQILQEQNRKSTQTSKIYLIISFFFC